MKLERYDKTDNKFIFLNNYVTLKCMQMQYTGLIFSLQFDIENPDEPFLVSIGRDGTPEGLPVEGLTGVSEITITFDVADDYTTVKVSDLFVRACNEGDYMHVFIII